MVDVADTSAKWQPQFFAGTGFGFDVTTMVVASDVEASQLSASYAGHRSGQISPD